MISFFLTLLVLSIVVFVHEWGHFIVARLCKLQVQRFSIGFGPVVFEYKDKKKTIWQISGLPLGGYIQVAQAKLFGLKKVLVSSAGPLMNFVFATGIFFCTFLYFGVLAISPVVQEVLPKSVAALNDIQVHDKIISVNGVAFEEIQTAIKQGNKVHLQIKRENETIEKDVMMTEPKLGIVFGTEMKSVTLSEAMKDSFLIVGNLCQKIFYGIFSRAGLKHLGGVVAVFSVSKTQYQSGWQPFLMFVGVFSVNLGFLNLLPIPILDGGHIIVGVYEMLTRKRINKAIYQKMMIVGLMIMFSVFVVSLMNDFGWGF